MKIPIVNQGVRTPYNSEKAVYLNTADQVLEKGGKYED